MSIAYQKEKTKLASEERNMITTMNLFQPYNNQEKMVIIEGLKETITILSQSIVKEI